jgi:hypothetical protein
MQIQITEEDLHIHLGARMAQRGIAKEELERTLNEGWQAEDAKPGTIGKVKVFSYQQEWEGRYFEEKEVSVYYKVIDNSLVLLTVKARYGRHFPKGEPR